MDDYISRRAAIDEILKGIYDFFDVCDDDEESPITYKDEVLLEVNKTITERIRKLPVREVRRGRWTTKEGDVAFYDVCSACGAKVLHKYPYWNYCPNCGADMRENE